MQQLADVQQYDQAALELADAGDVDGLTVGKHRAGRFDFRRWNFKDFRGGIDDKPDELRFQFDDQDAVFLVGGDFDLAKAFALVHHRDNLAAQVDHAFDGFLGIGNRGDFRHADDFAHGADPDSERFLTDAK